jgi:hypothetical protein
MLSEQVLAYEVLVEWELTGKLPDQESLDAACNELAGTEKLVERYRKFIDECQHHETISHLRPSSSPLSSEDTSADVNGD